MSDAAKKKAKQRWTSGKLKVDNSNQLRGMFFSEPNDEEIKFTMKTSRRKLEVPMPVAKYRKSSGENRKRKTKYACVIDPDESTRPS